MQERIPAQNIEAEQAVISAILIDNKAMNNVAEILKPPDFYRMTHQIIYKTMLEMHAKQQPIDMITVIEELKNRNKLDDVGGVSYITLLANIVPTSANALYHARIVVNNAIKRQLTDSGAAIAALGYEDDDVVQNLIDKAEQTLHAVSLRKSGKAFVPIHNILEHTMDRMNALQANGDTVTGLSTGFTDLDNRTAGFQNSDLILIAARPSMGKTALVLNIAQHLALKENRCVAIFSLEMSKEQLTNRLFSMESHVDAQKIRTGDLTEAEWADLVESAGNIGESKLIIDDTPAITAAELRSKCRKYKLEYGLEMIIIDYLQLMSGSGKSGESRQQEISEISRSLKAIARELNVPVVSLSQLSRAVESRPNHRPMLSDLRESGAIEQDADVVMFIYRDDYYNQDSEKKGIAEIIIAKQRNGPIGTVELSWQPALTKFANLAR